MPHRLLFSILAGLYLLAFFRFDTWPTSVLRADALGYYLHLPAGFIHRDLGDYSKSLSTWRLYNSIDPDPREDQYGLRTGPNGQRMNKYPLGVALLESPFFAVAHLYCTVSGGGYAADGFSRPYVLLIGLSSLFYALLGLWLLFRALRVHFSEKIAGSTVAIVALGTNLYYFATVNVGMAHPALFFGFALLIDGVQRWQQRPGARRAAQVGLALGLIVIARPPELIAVLIPVLWGAPFLLFRRLDRASFWAASGTFGALLLLQMAYWKSTSGQWLIYSYVGEAFHWTNPQISNGLLSYQNGWLVYTPVMLLAIVGLFFLKKRAPDAFWPLVAILPLHVYIIYAWWCWQYINGFGSRPMLDIYPLLAFSMAAFLDWGSAKVYGRWILGAFVIGCIALNLHQSWQRATGLLLSESNHEAFYWGMLGQNKVTRAAFIAYESKELQPRGQLRLLKTLGADNMENDTASAIVREPHHGGTAAFYCQSEFCRTVRVPLPEAYTGKWLKASVWAYVKKADYERRIDQVARLVVDIGDAAGKSLKYTSISIPSKIDNPDNILWSGGKADTWGEANLFIRIPSGAAAVSVYTWSPNGQKIVLDDVLVEVYE